MFENVLTVEQLIIAERLFPVIEGFYLAGGTAIALQIGHRRSIDFDLASHSSIDPFSIERRLLSIGIEIENVFTATTDEFSCIIDGIKITFFSYPFTIDHGVTWDRAKITLPHLMELGAMKAYALGRRSKWKDYVDLYFLLVSHFTINELITKAEQNFSKHFNSKLFREQLCYFEDIDYSEAVDYLDMGPTDNEIKEYLEKIAIQF